MVYAVKPKKLFQIEKGVSYKIFLCLQSLSLQKKTSPNLKFSLGSGRKKHLILNFENRQFLFVPNCSLEWKPLSAITSSINSMKRPVVNTAEFQNEPALTLTWTQKVFKVREPQRKQPAVFSFWPLPRTFKGCSLAFEPLTHRKTRVRLSPGTGVSFCSGPSLFELTWLKLTLFGAATLQAQKGKPTGAARGSREGRPGCQTLLSKNTSAALRGTCRRFATRRSAPSLVSGIKVRLCQNQTDRWAASALYLRVDTNLRCRGEQSVKFKRSRDRAPHCFLEEGFKKICVAKRIKYSYRSLTSPQSQFLMAWSGLNFIHNGLSCLGFECAKQEQARYLFENHPLNSFLTSHHWLFFCVKHTKLELPHHDAVMAAN